jgi:threonine dehydratase
MRASVGASAAGDRVVVAEVYERIRGFLRVTPVVAVQGADFGLGAWPLALKLEQLQHAGSFKTRGAFANLMLREVPAAGVVAASGGNHGAAVAYAAMRLGVPAKIFVPTVSSPAKIARIRSYGAELTVAGGGYAEALAASEEWAAESGAMAVHAFDQAETLLGPATLGLELSGQAPDLDTLLVAVGGGGLIGGLAAWYGGGPVPAVAARGGVGGDDAGGGDTGGGGGLHPAGRRVRIVGVEPHSAPTLTAALAAGRPVDAPAGGIAADSLAPRRVGELMFPIARRHVERVVLVADADIHRAQQTLWEALRVVAEPGGAAAFSALLSGAYQPAPGERVAVVVSGGNTTAVEFGEFKA